MRLFFILPLIFTISCKANNHQSDSGLTNKDPEPVMGGPTNLTIKLDDYAGNGTAKIIGFYFDQNFLADSIVFQNGLINYKKAEGLPQGLYYVSISGRKEYIQLILGKDQEFDVSLSIADILGTAKINGSLENEVFYENMRYESQMNPKINDLAAKLKAMQTNSPEYAGIKAEKESLELTRLNTIKELRNKYADLLYPSYKFGGQNPKLREDLPADKQIVQYRREFWDNVNFKDTRLLRTPMIGNKIKRYMKELTAQHQDSILSSAHFLMKKVMDQPEYFKAFANWVVLSYEPAKCNLMDAESVFVGMVKNYFTKEKAFWQDSLQTNVIQQRAREMSQSLLGQKAPNVIASDPTGKKQELLAKTADYIVVYLFNPDCEHCQEQTPKLLQFYNENKANGIDVYAIAIDTDDAKWKAYISKNNLGWTNVHDPSNRSIYGKYWVDVTPEIYVVNKKREIIGKNLKVEQIRTVVDRDKAKGI